MPPTRSPCPTRRTSAADAHRHDRLDPRLAWLAPSIVGPSSRCVGLPADAAARASPSATGARCRPCSHVLGVAHPTGYPTYVLLGWLAQLVPIGSGRVPAQPAVGGPRGDRPRDPLRDRAADSASDPSWRSPAPSPSARSGTVWAAATVAEVNPLHLLFCALLIHRALVWETRRRPIDLVARRACSSVCAREPPADPVRGPVRRRCSSCGSGGATCSPGRGSLLPATCWRSSWGCPSTPYIPLAAAALAAPARTTTRRRSTTSGGWSAAASSATSSTSSPRRVRACSSPRSGRCATSRSPGRRRSCRSSG